MKAIVIPTPNEIEIREVPMPEVKEGEALLKVKYVGICGADVASFTGNHKEFVVIDDDTYGVTLVNYMQTDMFVVFSITDGGIVIDNIYLSKPRATYGNTRGIVIDDYVFVVSSSGILAYEFGQDY